MCIFDRLEYCAVDLICKSCSYKVRVYKRRKIRKSQTEAGLNCCIYVLRACDTVFNDGDSFSPESMLQAVCILKYVL